MILRRQALHMLEYQATTSLYRAAFLTHFDRDLDTWGAERPWGDALEAARTAPVARGEDLRKAVRALLREGGHKPSGRGKPSSEYLARAVEAEGLPEINLAVDTCNLVSFQSGVPISVVDLDRIQQPMEVRLGEPESSYVFNASEQEIRLDGLLCLWDTQGPCANAVKDSHRTKTGPQTRRTATILWGPAAFAEHLEATVRWYCSLLELTGAKTERL